jgi:hypothetical protein
MELEQWGQFRVELFAVDWFLGKQKQLPLLGLLYPFEIGSYLLRNRIVGPI